jgi:hypothetical protein
MDSCPAGRSIDLIRLGIHTYLVIPGGRTSNPWHHHLGTGNDLWMEVANGQPVLSDIHAEYTVSIRPRPRISVRGDVTFGRDLSNWGVIEDGKRWCYLSDDEFRGRWWCRWKGLWVVLTRASTHVSSVSRFLQAILWSFNSKITFLCCCSPIVHTRVNCNTGERTFRAAAQCASCIWTVHIASKFVLALLPPLWQLLIRSICITCTTQSLNLKFCRSLQHKN